MARPKPALLVNVTFSVRTSRGERDAIDEMGRRWAAEREAATGLPSAGDNLTTWFRSTVRKLAAEQGIAVVEPAPEPVAKRKRAGKSG